MKNNWIRFLAGALVSVMLVGAFALTGGMKGGKSTEGLLYQASGLHPDGEMLVVDGQIVTCEEYLYWVDYVCTYLASQLPDDRHVFLIAAAGETVLGYANFLHVLDEGDIGNVAVAPEFRRQGVADALLEALCARAAALDLAFLTLEVRASNAPAIALYRKHGFQTVGQRRNYYQKPDEDALLMTWFRREAETI